MSKIFTVTEFTSAIKSILEPSFRNVSVQGEISNLKVQSSGHVYFSIKDAGAQLSAVLFKGSATKLPRLPKEGEQVILTGELSLYAPRGSYQIVVRELQFAGLGELLLRLQQLKETLAARGWFDPVRKKQLPKLPKRIGVVTSPTGAVIQDILNVLTRRFRGFQIVLNPVKVQGEGAAQEIAQAIHDFNQHNLADVLIVGRGGGSIEDLWAFNEEIVAQAIFESKIPIISAVGHETDVTISDWVADVRAPTPSAAAEIVIAEKGALLTFLHQCRSLVHQRMGEKMALASQRLTAYKKQPLFASPYNLLAIPMQRLDQYQEEIEASCRRLLQKKQLIFENAQKRMPNPQKTVLELKRRLEAIRENLGAIHPNRLLQKGYTILFSQKTGSVILSPNQLSPGDKVQARLGDGAINATVDAIEYERRTHTIF